MKNKIEYYVESGKQGGYEGAEVDFGTKTINYTHTAAEKFNAKNIEDVQWVIDGYIAAMNKEIKRIKKKISLKEITREPIENGYKLLQPCTPKLKKILENKMSLLKTEIKELEDVDLLKMI